METTDLVPSILKTIREDLKNARDDIKNARDDIARLDTKLTTRIDHVAAKLEAVDARLTAKIEVVDVRLTAQIDTFQLKLDDTARQLNARIDGESERHTRLAGKVELLAQRMDRFHDRLVENEIRMNTRFDEVQYTLERIAVAMGGHNQLELRIERCEHDIVDLKERVF